MPRRKRITVSVTEVKRHLGFYIDLCRRTDVVICRRGIPIAVLISISRYRRLRTAMARRFQPSITAGHPKAGQRKSSGRNA